MLALFLWIEHSLLQSSLIPPRLVNVNSCTSGEFFGFQSSAAEVFVLWDDAACHPRQMETQMHITLLLQIIFRFTRPTPELWLYNKYSSFNSGYCWPPEWGHAETLCKKAVSVHEYRACNSYKRRGLGNCLKQRMVVRCHTGCVWDRATTTFKFLMDHASGTIHLFIEVTNICSLSSDKHIQFAKRDHTKSFFLLLTYYLE